ncbi:MAG: N-6 DNA methylase [Deltaproteobacteria bacterium]|nr:N-6 DNA methylase [Deltaproteobacteria bacterium]MCL5278266.1 N-6 DNA methylase [Deltaproteobacteria bacterium]
MDTRLPQEVSALIERFERNQQSYLSSQYNEAQLRQEFINPFFESLGWDVRNINGNAEAYKDVIHEDAIKIGSAVKAPDYCFRIGGTRKFFVEAKKPFVKIEDNSDAAFQLRRYAWSAKLPLGILTNFKEFAVYDCRIDPVKDDKASTARISYFTYKDYPQQWDYLASVFSKESVLKGSFDKYAESSKLKRGTATVDEKFLKEIESWRSELAHKIAIRNTKLTTRELNFAVQRTIDRIIFLRICEDRGMEQYGKLQSLMNGVNVYKRLFEVFQKADQRYNSGLFHFSKERDRQEEPDNLTPFLNIDDDPIKDIINRLYYPESPYEFSVLSADILGQVYEQFLGKVIRLTEGHHAKIEEKPEVRKAGGIYYTPTYIVDYIVKNTVGKLVEGKTPKQVSKLRILDPACGSGSFLIGAYQYLLDWHLDWYIKDGAEKYAKAARPILYQAGGTHAGHGSGSYRLTTYERKRILLNNIYGVDIDPQAVEVTKLSLLLKVLEGENSQTLDVQYKLFHERALPDLENNIKCGNSLIGPDFYQQQSLNLFNDDERLRINAFDWNTEFKDIMSSGGFDAVIGNPPWISLSGKFGNDIHSKDEISYLIGHFKGNTYMPNIYEYFIAQGLNLSRLNGYFSFIVPDRLGYNNQFVQLRKRILTETNIISLLYKAPFPDITADTLVFVFFKSKPKIEHTIIISEFQKVPIKLKQNEIMQQSNHVFEYFEDIKIMPLIKHISSISSVIFLGEICESTSGFGGKTELIQEHKTNQNQIPTLKGDSIERYKFRKSYWFDFCKQNITGRTTDKSKLGAIPKVLIRKTGSSIIATYDNSGIFPEQSLYFLFNIKTKIDFKFLLGILNSKLLTFYYRAKCLTNKNSIAQAKKVDLDQLPIYKVDQSNANGKARHDRMVYLVDQMLTLNKQLPTVKTDHEKTALQRQIDSTDKQIDELVYELYGITDEERKIIEGLG